MITRMVGERIGEYLGPVDWSFDFSQGVRSMGGSEAYRASRVAKWVELLWEVERKHLRSEPLKVIVNGYYKDLLTVGMYDGWPYWTPTPAVCVMGTLGPEWDFYYSIDGWREAR